LIDNRAAPAHSGMRSFSVNSSPADSLTVTRTRPFHGYSVACVNFTRPAPSRMAVTLLPP
jgi:hypothetical protein